MSSVSRRKNDVSSKMNITFQHRCTQCATSTKKFYAVPSLRVTWFSTRGPAVSAALMELSVSFDARGQVCSVRFAVVLGLIHQPGLVPPSRHWTPRPHPPACLPQHPRHPHQPCYLRQHRHRSPHHTLPPRQQGRLQTPRLTRRLS